MKSTTKTRPFAGPAVLIAALGFLWIASSEAAASAAPDSGNPTGETVSAWHRASETVYRPDGSVDKAIRYSYGDDGRLIEVVEENSRGKMVYRRRYAWDENRQIAQTLFDELGIVSKTEYIFDGTGRVAKEVRTSHDDEVLATVEYEYSGDRVVTTISSSGGGVNQLVSILNYRGEELASIDYQLPDGSSEGRFERIFSGERVIGEQTILPDGTVETSKVFEYDGSTPTREIHYTGNVKSKMVRFETDAAGNIVKETWMDRNGGVYEIIEHQWAKIEMREQP